MAEEDRPQTEVTSDPPQPDAEAQAGSQQTAAGESRTQAQPAEVLSPKERKRRAKAAKGPRRPSTPQEREAARARKRELRRQARARLREKRPRERPAGEAELTSAAQAEPPRRGAGRQKTRQGVVVSDRAAKTITVRIDTAHRHPRYEKIVRTSRTLHAHDERGEAHIGDTVVVRECRPMSRTKRWRLERILERAG